MNSPIPTALQAPRPNRASRRAVQLGIDQGPNKLAAPVAPRQPVQIGIAFAHSEDCRQMAMIVTVGPNQIPVQLTPDSWEELAANGDAVADKVRAALAAPSEPEPDPVYDDDDAVLIRKRIEECAVAYGKYRLYRHGIGQAFRHPNHMKNWAAKHKLDVEPDPECGDVMFYPAATPLPGPTLETATPV
jgi:hypothetical protein